MLFVFFHQNLHGALRERQQAQGVFRFWLADNKLMVDAADAFGNGKCSLLHVQIFPEQGQQFSPAQAAGQFQIERCKHAALLCTMRGLSVVSFSGQSPSAGKRWFSMQLR